MEAALDDNFGVAVDDFSSQSIGPTFGEQIAQTALIAVIASLLLISLYIGFRFEWKFAVPILIALAHDLLITGGVYALFGREVTTSTVAALLTIMGYSLYDTVIVFDRIRENVPRMPRATFSQIANRSMSEVFTRSLATSFVVLMPVGALLFFGGDTLKDFAFALLVGVASGAYSSIFIATPVLVEWKEREQVYMRRRRLVMEQFGGIVPAFATGAAAAAPAVAAAGAGGSGAARAADLAREPRRAASRTRRGPQTGHRAAPHAPGAAAGSAHGAHHHQAARPGQPAARRRGRQGAGAPTRRRRQRRTALAHQLYGGPPEAEAAASPKEARSPMSLVVWVMMGIALWHFTVFVPDRFWGGIVGAFLASAVFAALFGYFANGLTVPGSSDTDITQALIAVPGALIGLSLSYWWGARVDRDTTSITGSRARLTLMDLLGRASRWTSRPSAPSSCSPRGWGSGGRASSPGRRKPSRRWASNRTRAALPTNAGPTASRSTGGECSPVSLHSGSCSPGR